MQMFKALVKKQLQETFTAMFGGVTKGKRNGKSRSKVAVAALILLLLYAYGVIGVMFFMMAQTLSTELISAGRGWLYFAVMGCVAALFGVIGSVFTTYTSLYAAKDNEFLLSMPIPPRMILLVRMLGVYIMAVFFEALVLIPTGIAYIAAGAAGITEIILGVLLLVILPVFSLGISCILGWIIAFFASKVKNKSFISVIISLAFIVGYYFVYSKAYSYLQLIIVNSEKIGEAFKSYIYPLYIMGLGAEGNILAFIGFTAIIAAFFAIIYYILSVSFLKLTTSQGRVKKAKYHAKKVKAVSADSALLRREFMHFVSSAVYMLNCGLGTVFMLVLSVVALIYAGTVKEALSMLPSEINSAVPLIVAAALASCVMLNGVTAPSISIEGKTLHILRALPVSAWQILRAKLSLHMIITAIPAVILAFVLSFILYGNELSYILLTVLFTVIFTYFCAEFGLVLNLKMPNLDWRNETVAVKQSLSVLVYIFASMATVLLLVGLYFAVSGFITDILYLISCTVLIAAIAAVMHIYLKKSGAAAFDKLS